jgi:hypothetical protein
MRRKILSFILIILIIYIIYKRNIGYIKLKKLYNKNFDFNNNSYKYYDIITRFTIQPSSDIKNTYLFDKFKINKKDVILDYGSGNCFNLLNINKSSNFKKLIGVEIDEHNFNKCLKNLNLLEDNYKNKFKIINKNAENYKIPNDVTYIYFFNPFQRNYNIGYKIEQKELKTYKKVIENILDSIKEKKRKITIIFMNITPNHDKEQKIFKLFKMNFKILEFNKYKFNNLFSNMKYAIFTN